MVDRYPEVIKRVKDVDSEITRLIEQRDQQIQQKQKTGKVEYQLQDKILKAEVDIKKLEGLA